jgi:anti-sigma B factor antagonist
MSLLAQIRAEHHGDVAVAEIDGEIDASNTALVGDRLRALLGNHSTALVVDLSPTTYLDSAGINMLFELAAELDQRQQRLHLVVPEASALTRAIAITGLDEAVATHASRAAALEQT